MFKPWTSSDEHLDFLQPLGAVIRWMYECFSPPCRCSNYISKQTVVSVSRAQIFLNLLGCAAPSESLLTLMLLLSGSTSNSCSLSASSRDSSRTSSSVCVSSSICRRETIPPALLPPLGISRKQRANKATDTVTAWPFIPVAPPAAKK